VEREQEALRRGIPAAADRPGRDDRVPVRSPDVRGPLEVYYYDHLKETLGEDGDEPAILRRDRGELLAYEALNLVDGQRSVAEVRDVLTGRYEGVDVAEVAEYLELLARAGVIRWKEAAAR
jgi:aminopeptidase YwaD